MPKKPVKRSKPIRGRLAAVAQAVEAGADSVPKLCKAFGYTSPQGLYQNLLTKYPKVIKLLRDKGRSKNAAMEANDGKGLINYMRITGEAVRRNAASAIHHDVELMAKKVKKQRRMKELDPNFEPSRVVESPNEFKSLIQTAQALGGMGLAETGGGTKVEVLTTVNHATIMRSSDFSHLLADPNQIPDDAFVIEDSR